MSEADDILAALLGEAGLEPASPAPKHFVESPLPQTPGAKKKTSDEINEVRLPWPETYLNGHDPHDNRATRALWASVLAAAIRDARSAYAKFQAGKIVGRTSAEIQFVTTPNRQLQFICDAVDINHETVVSTMRREFFDALS